MIENLSKQLKNKKFEDLWSDAKSEIFSLELLNTYLVDYEEDAFNRYKKGLEVNCLEIPGFKKWLEDINHKTKNNVRVLDIQVLDLPMSDYLKFGISCASFLAEKKGEKFMFVERNKVSDIIKDVEDYWLFDSKVVLPMKYDKKGRFIGRGVPTTDPIIVSECVYIRDNLLKKAQNMKEFLKENNIDLFKRKIKR